MSPDATPPYAIRLRAIVEAAQPRLAALTDADSMHRSAQGRWSPREVIGHLVDSAIVNQQRFLRGALEDGLVFPGYPQEEWVTLQAYQEATWPELVVLWGALNRHVARVMARVPATARERPRTEHALDRIAMRRLPAAEPATLDYLMADYVAHLEHHVRQVLGADWAPALHRDPAVIGAEDHARGCGRGPPHA